MISLTGKLSVFFPIDFTGILKKFVNFQMLVKGRSRGAVYCINRDSSRWLLLSDFMPFCLGLPTEGTESAW